MKFRCESSGLEDEFIKPLLDARDEKIKECEETIGTYLQKQMNYEETDTGFNLEISPELLEYTIEYAEAKEAGYANDSDAANMGGIAASALLTATGFGVGVGILIGIFTYAASYKLNKTANQWENLANELEHYMDTDKPLKIQVIGEEVFVDEIDENN